MVVEKGILKKLKIIHSISFLIKSFRANKRFKELTFLINPHFLPFILNVPERNYYPL
jgi:hypothetical protein